MATTDEDRPSTTSPARTTTGQDDSGIATDHTSPSGGSPGDDVARQLQMDTSPPSVATTLTTISDEVSLTSHKKMEEFRGREEDLDKCRPWNEEWPESKSDEDETDKSKSTKESGEDAPGQVLGKCSAMACV